LAQKNNSISLDAIRQRGGWSDFEMLNYYTQLIGLSGEIKKESLLIEEDRTKLEKDMIIMKKKMKVLADYTQLAFLKNYTKKELEQMKEQVYNIEKDQFEEKLLEKGK